MLYSDLSSYKLKHYPVYSVSITNRQQCKRLRLDYCYSVILPDSVLCNRITLCLVYASLVKV